MATDAEPTASAAVELRRWLAAQCEASVYPGYQALVVEPQGTVFSAYGGRAVIAPERAVTATTLFDLASLTKPLITALLALRLAEDGVLPLELPVSRVLDYMCPEPLTSVTVLDLLTHRAGFEPWAALYLAQPPSLQRYARAIANRPGSHGAGEEVVYSDLGYLVLGAAIEAVAGMSFLEAARREVLEPMARADLAFPPTAEQREQCAATEEGNRYECELAGREWGTRGFRRDLICGSVHDGNAWGLGGCAPHAGLFATAHAVVALTAELCEGYPARLLGAASRALVGVDLTPNSKCRRTVAFELAASPGTAATGSLPDDAFGHTGFTGTSVWVEPSRRRIYVLLTNRVHPRVTQVNMNDVRRRFHSLASEVVSPVARNQAAPAG